MARPGDPAILPSDGGHVGGPTVTTVHATTRHDVSTGNSSQRDEVEFRSTPPCGGRRQAGKVQVANYTFRSTPSCGGRPGRGIRPGPVCCFDPRPHAEGDHSGDVLRADVDVSIHAFMRRATISATASCLEPQFRSMPSCGGRRWPTPGRAGARGFDPRPHAEGDSSSAAAAAPSSCFDPRPHAEGDSRPTSGASRTSVSIHALMRRATRCCHAG